MTQDRMADSVFIANRVLTMGARRIDGRGFVAVKDGRVLAAGPLVEMSEYVGSQTELNDYGDRLIMPGFIDAHCHLEVGARTNFKHVDIRAPRCRNIADVLEKLRAAIPDRVYGGWLMAQGNLFFDQKLAERRFPTRAELDSVSSEIPIAIQAGGHVSLLNSKALEICGIDADFVPPPYSVLGKCIVERDAAGELTGIVKEMDNVLPFPKITGNDLREALRGCARDYFTAYGVTSICEISETLEGLQCMTELQRDNQFPLRVATYLWSPGTMSLEQACRWQEHISPASAAEWFEVQGVKIFTDGGFSSANAAMNRPFVHRADRSHGELAMSKEEIRHYYEVTRAAGLGLSAHANGERAQETACEAVIEAGGPGTHRPMRLEHGGNFLPDYERTVGLWREAGVLTCPQPVFLFGIGDFFPVYLGEDGKRGRFPFRRMLQDGLPVAGSSDLFSGSELNVTNPFFGIWCGVERTTYLGNTIDPEQRLSVEEALYMYTVGAATVMGHDAIKGSLEPGKLADIIVLDVDPRDLKGKDILKTRVDAVIVGGVQVHQRVGAQTAISYA